MSEIKWGGFVPAVVFGLGAGFGAGCSSSASPGDAGCQAETDQAFCLRLGANCNLFSGFDNCGASRSVNCGTCAGTCDANVCRSASTSGTTSSGATTGGTVGGATGSSSTGGTSGGTTGSTGTEDAGCTSTACDGYQDIFTASFVLGAFGNHADGTLDSLVGEHITMVIGFNGSTPENLGAEGWQFPNSPAAISISGDTAGLIAADMLSSWESGGSYLTAGTSGGLLDFELLPTDQSGTFFTYEMICIGTEPPGQPLVSTDCSSPSVVVRYFIDGDTVQDSISSTSATVSLFALDAG